MALRRLMFITAMLTVLCVAYSIDDKCAACNAVAEELELGIIKEKPRNHLDMRHRLDSKGQREGKVIDYRVSDLRVVDLLDGLCDKMQDYTLQKIDSNKKTWIKVDDWDDITSNKQEARAHSKEISSYCGRLLEETEDERTKKDIINGAVHTSWDLQKNKENDCFLFLTLAAGSNNSKKPQRDQFTKVGIKQIK
ncbi:protein canopy-1 [Tanacetum coccineum]